MAATDPQHPHQLTHIVLGDSPDAWRTAGFDVDHSGRLRLGRTELQCLDSGTAGFIGWALDGIDDSLDGLSTTDGNDGLGGPEVPSAHPNGICSIDHVVIASADCARTIDAFTAAGLAVRGGRSTRSYGSQMRQTFFWAGDVILELIGPEPEAGPGPDGDTGPEVDTGPDGDTGPDREPDGTAAPTSDEPTSIFGLALVTTDLDATAASLGAFMGTPKSAVQPGRRIAGMRHRDLGIGLPIAVMSPHPR